MRSVTLYILVTTTREDSMKKQMRFNFDTRKEALAEMTRIGAIKGDYEIVSDRCGGGYFVVWIRKQGN
jgi:hypothetical protein